MRNTYIVLFGKHEQRDHSKDIDIDRRILLECNLEKYGGKVWTGCTWLRIGTSGGPL
jgi:hypothetical protein